MLIASTIMALSPTSSLVLVALARAPTSCLTSMSSLPHPLRGTASLKTLSIPSADAGRGGPAPLPPLSASPHGTADNGRCAGGVTGRTRAAEAGLRGLVLAVCGASLCFVASARGTRFWDGGCTVRATAWAWRRKGDAERLRAVGKRRGPEFGWGGLLWVSSPSLKELMGGGRRVSNQRSTWCTQVMA